MYNPPLKSASGQLAGLLPLLAWLFVWSALVYRLEAAYKYPIGIPKAWIEPDVVQPARPDPWISEIAGYYYVSFTTGTDTGRTYGRPGAPRKTIPSPIPAGSRVEVSGAYGSTSGGWFITFDGDGGEWVANTSGPAWLIGAVGNRASFFGWPTFLGKYGCIDFIDNFGSHKSTSINSGTAGKGRTGHHFLVRNSEFTGTASANDNSGGFVVCGNTDVGGEGSYLVFYNNEVHHFGLADPNGTDPDYIAFFVTANCNHIWVLDNKLHDMSGSAMNITAVTDGHPVTTTHVYAGRNECYNLWATGMGSKTAQYVIYSENHIHHIKEATTTNSNAKGLACQYGATDIWWIFNRIHDVSTGMKVASGGGVNIYMIGNLVYDVYNPGYLAFNGDDGYGAGGIVIWGLTNHYLINNTLNNVPHGIITNAATVIFAENNIISNVNEVDGKHFYAQMSGVGKDVRINRNLFYQDGTVKVSLPGVPMMTVTALNASAYGKGNLAGDPLFANVASKTFSLLTHSPAKDAGLEPTALQNDVYALYFKTFGVSIERDINGSVRPVGPAWDIGAYERSKSISSPPKMEVEIIPK